MARLLGSVEAWFATDFAMLIAEQEPGSRPDAMCFATTARGVVTMVCGLKYADVHVRLQRWDAPPPLDLPAWEDRDELPFQEQVGAGPLMLSGFDPADAPGLDVAGLGRARIRVLANGRHRYGYGDRIVDGRSPEEWLLQLWPDPAGQDAMAGEPRRLAGPLPFGPQAAGRTVWAVVSDAWRQSAWDAFFSHLGAFDGLHLGLLAAKEPVRRAELPALVTRMRRDSLEGEPSLDARLVCLWDVQRAALDLLGRHVGYDVSTVGDLITALMASGLLATTRDDEAVLNPAPPAVWDVLDLPERTRRSVGLAALQAGFGPVEGDLLHLIRWARGQSLHTTPRSIALRLAMPVSVVLGGFQLLEAKDLARTQPDAATLTADAPMTAARPGT